jgi:predicted MFS family arabinose efflux permease
VTDGSTGRFRSERAILFLVAAVQVVNVLDFMMVTPLGSYLAEGLTIPESRLGLVAGSYTASAAVAGLVASTFLDRFDRRNALATAMLGLVIATAAGGLARGFPSLIAARVMAGAFGGPATSLSLSIVADLVPPARRGKAMGAVMSAFTVASVLGIPVGLKLAEWGGWRVPFFAIAGLGLVVASAARLLLPSLRIHLAGDVPRTTVRAGLDILRERVVQLSLLSTATVMISVFSIVPFIAPYFEHNLGYPRERLWLPYAVGGIGGFLVMRAFGHVVDRIGSPRVSVIGTVLYLAVIYVGFGRDAQLVAPIVVFVWLMLSSSIRAVAMGALTSRVPRPRERARFMSIQSAVQHMSSALGAFAASGLLRARADGTLLRMPRVAAIAMACAATLPLLLRAVERRVKAREADGAPPAAPVPPALPPV